MHQGDFEWRRTVRALNTQHHAARPESRRYQAGAMIVAAVVVAGLAIAALAIAALDDGKAGTCSPAGGAIHKAGTP